MPKKQTYTAAEKAAFAAGKAAATKTKAPAKKTASAKKAPAKKADTEHTKRSGCEYHDTYIAGEDSKYGKKGEVIARPKITGWRITSQGFFQSFEAYLGKDDGKPQNGQSPDVCRIFVVNITTKGIGESTATGVWSMKYKKLSMTKLDLVANPDAPRGGYFGRGGKRYADKVK